MDRKGCVVRLHNCIGNFGRGYDRIGIHDPIRIFFPDFGNEKGSHSGSGTTSKGMGQLKSLETIAGLGLLAYNIKDGVHKLGT